MIVNIEERELATVLAALRVYQRDLGEHGPEVEDIATDGRSLIALDPNEIDRLCERLNTRNPEKGDRVVCNNCGWSGGCQECSTPKLMVVPEEPSRIEVDTLGGTPSTLWLTVRRSPHVDGGAISVYVRAVDDGVSISMYPLNHEMENAVVETWCEWQYEEER